MDNESTPVTIDFNKIIAESPEKLYEEAILHRENKDYNKYHIYMIMAANKEYDLAIQALFDDCQNTMYHLKQDLPIDKEFYEFLGDGM